MRRTEVLPMGLPWWFHGGSMGTSMGIRWEHSASMETYMLLSWCPHFHGTSMMLPWDFHETSMEAQWCFRGDFHGSIVLPWGVPWCFHGTFMVLPWRLQVVPWKRLCFHGSSKARPSGGRTEPRFFHGDLHGAFMVLSGGLS